MDETLAFIGGGNMAGAIIGGLIKGGRRADSILVVDPFDAQRVKLQADFGVRTLAVADVALARAALVVWAIKPQLFAAAAAPCAPHVGAALHLSVMAGIRSDAIARVTGSERVVRAMPNTPALTAWRASPKKEKASSCCLIAVNRRPSCWNSLKARHARAKHRSAAAWICAPTASARKSCVTAGSTRCC